MATNGFLEKEKLTAICDSIRAKTGSTGLIPIDDIPQAIANIQTGGGIIEVDELPELWESTVVPNGGFVVNLYFNTNLSINDVANICKKNSHYIGNDGFYNIVLKSNDDSNTYILYYSQESDLILIANNSFIYDYENQNNIIFSSHKYLKELTLDFYGWNPNISYPITINLEMDEIEKNNNELFKDLVSTTPFVRINTDIKENTLYKINPVAIPNSGKVEKIYFNTNINNEQYHNILKNVTFLDASLIGSSGWSFYAVMAYLVGQVPYVLAFKKFSDDNIDLALVNFSTMETVQDFYDGSGADLYEFENPYYIGYEVLSTLSGLPIGNQNEVIKEILSLTSFNLNILQDNQFIELVKKY